MRIIRFALVLFLLALLAGCWNPMSQYVEYQKKAQEAQKKAEIQKQIAEQIAQAQTRQARPQQQPDTNVQRQPGNTPEITGATPRSITTGTTGELVLHGGHLLPGGTIEASGICHLKAGQIVSDTEARVTLAVDDNENGECNLNLQAQNRNNVWYTVELALSPAAQQARATREAAERQKQQQEAAAAQQKMQQYMSHAKDIMGTKWTVQLPGGKSDVWTKTGGNEMLGAVGEFKNSKGTQFQLVISERDETVVNVDNCVYQGKISGGKVTGKAIAMPGCTAGAWSGTISK